MKKKIRFNFRDWKQILLIPAILASLGGIGFAARQIVFFMELRGKVEAGQQYDQKVDQFIGEQRKMNEMVAEKLGLNEPILSPDGKFYWNKEKEKWKPISELEKYEPR